MKICWDNLEKLRYNKERDLWKKGNILFKYMNSCKTCKEPFLISFYKVGVCCSTSCSAKDRPPPFLGKKHSPESKAKIKKNHADLSGVNHYMWGKKVSNDVKLKISKAKGGPNHPNFGKHLSNATKEKIRKSKLGVKNPNWKGGVTEKNIPLFNTYAPQIDWCESVRRDLGDYNILNVKCKKCGSWFIPTVKSAISRIWALTGKLQGECNFYCSNNCKESCEVYGQILYPKNNKPYRFPRSLQHEWADLVKERDGYKCVKCSSTKDLVAHHKEGIRWEPLESADIDMGITLCRKCNKEAHKKDNCSYYNMRCM